MKRAIADDVRRFVLTSIPSVPYLEAALLFHARPATEHTTADVARALYMPERAAAELLQALQQAGIVAPADGAPARFRYAPADPGLAGTLDALAGAYAADLIGITTLIHDATQKKAQRFADAFKLRKDS